MSMQNYQLRIEEDDDGEGITVDVFGEDGTITETTYVAYADHGIAVDRGNGDPGPIETEVTADVMTTDLQIARGDGAFEFRFVGDGEPLATERVTDDDWGLVAAD
jgi:hypothetical protein